MTSIMNSRGNVSRDNIDIIEHVDDTENEAKSTGNQNLWRASYQPTMTNLGFPIPYLMDRAYKFLRHANSSFFRDYIRIMTKEDKSGCRNIFQNDIKRTKV